MMCATLAFAQVDFSQLRYGVRAGFGGGMVDVKLEDDDNESQNGFQYFIGAAVELPVWKFIRVTGEIYFEHTGVSDHIKSMRMTGATAGDATIFTDVTTKYPLNYIHIPIMARACFVKDFIFVETGPQIGFLVGNVKTHTEGTITTKPNSPMFPSQVQKINEDNDNPDHIKRTHAGWVLGWGGNFGSARQFSAGIRICFGLNDLQDPDYKIDGCRVTHSDVQLSMRYWF